MRMVILIHQQNSESVTCIQCYKAKPSACRLQLVCVCALHGANGAQGCVALLLLPWCALETCIMCNRLTTQSQVHMMDTSVLQEQEPCLLYCAGVI